ncbi:Uncharacterised protein [Vibrio cholerae]|nr:Uncharacterised protein [Vibrio cholerae]
MPFSAALIAPLISLVIPARGLVTWSTNPITIISFSSIRLPFNV